ncbi:MAG: mRNA surveillance protein pelota [Methanopyraceae archaeon]
MSVKILEKDLDKGYVEVLPETLDDLWHLYHIVRKGDLVFALERRRVKDERAETIRRDKGERRPVYLGVRVEDTEFDKYSNRLRIKGIIEHGPESGSHHTINVTTGKRIKVVKEEWDRKDLERLEEAEMSRPPVLLVAVDAGEGTLGIVRDYGLDVVARVRHNVPGKRGGDRRAELREFFHRLADEIERVMKEEGVEHLVVGGPGFVKEEFAEFLREERGINPAVEDTGSADESGLVEMIRRGAVERVVEESRVAEEARHVEEVFKRIGRGDDTVAYGLEDCKRAAEFGAVETLLIADEVFRRAMVEGDEDVRELVEYVERTGGDVLIVSTEHEWGERLLELGGVAALLRFGLPG